MRLMCGQECVNSPGPRPAGLLWLVIVAGELADLCADNPGGTPPGVNAYIRKRSRHGLGLLGGIQRRRTPSNIPGSSPDHPRNIHGTSTEHPRDGNPAAVARAPAGAYARGGARSVERFFTAGENARPHNEAPRDLGSPR